MRFEAKHREAKQYFNSITSRVNPAKSLSIKSGLKFSKFILSHKDIVEPVYTLFDEVVHFNLTTYPYFKQICEMPNINATQRKL